jgi:hypothetical protein
MTPIDQVRARAQQGSRQDATRPDPATRRPAFPKGGSAGIPGREQGFPALALRGSAGAGGDLRRARAG